MTTKSFGKILADNEGNEMDNIMDSSYLANKTLCDNGEVIECDKGRWEPEHLSTCGDCLHDWKQYYGLSE